MRYCIKILLLLSLPTFITPVKPQDKGRQNYTSLFQNEDLLKVSLHFDITNHMRKKNNAYSPGKIVIYESENDSTTFKVKYRVRGNFRKEHCTFPPLMLNFKPDTLFSEDGYLTKVKLVSHCMNSKLYTRILLKEYLIYKLWQIISPYALRTRLLDISYQNTDNKNHNSRHLGFLIEPLQMMAHRTETIEIKGKYFKAEEINELDADRVAIFNYMIGNTDWRIQSAHNIKFIKRFGHRREEISAIPYDFDHSGLINAPYANPAEWSTAESVIERDYCGHCRTFDDNYYILTDEFLNAEEEIYQTIMEFEHLDIKTRKQVYRYINTFYKEIKRTKSFIHILNNTCMEKY